MGLLIKVYEEDGANGHQYVAEAVLLKCTARVESKVSYEEAIGKMIMMTREELQDIEIDATEFS